MASFSPNTLLNLWALIKDSFHIHGDGFLDKHLGLPILIGTSKINNFQVLKKRM